MADAVYNNARLKAGDFVPVQYPKTASALIKGGDLCYQETAGTLTSAKDFTWNASLAQTQTDFHDAFAGVAIDGSLAAETRDVTVAPTGVAEYPCAAVGSQLEIGTYIGPAQGTGNTLDPQKVVNVATSNLAIGRLAKRALVGATTMLVIVAGDKTTPYAGTQATT